MLQDKVVEAAEAAGFEMLAPTNADSDSAQQNTDIRNLISAGADALIVFANDSNAIVPLSTTPPRRGCRWSPSTSLRTAATWR